MILEVYGAALLIVAGSMAIGRAVMIASGVTEPAWAAPAVGFAALVVLTTAAIELPGRAAPAVAAAVVAFVVSVVFLWRRRAWPVGWDGACAGGVAALVASLPFVANGRVGLPGVSLDDDTAQFLLYTESLRSPRVDQLFGATNGYPLGPHGVAATVSSGAGIPLDLALTGLLIAIVPITAVTALGVMRGAPPWRRVPVAVLCSLPYLSAAYYAEGSFKETVMGLLLLALVVYVDEVIIHPGRGASRPRMLLPAALLLAAAIYTYSYIAAAWFGGALVLWLVASAVLGARTLRRAASRISWRSVARWVGAGALMLIILLIPVADQLRSFFTSVGVSPAASAAIPVNALGNLVHPLPFSESLGLWWSADFRLAPVTSHQHALVLAAQALLIGGLIWSVARRELLLAAAVIASLLIWWHANRSQSPYVAAKGLVIAAPLVMALDLRMLFGVPRAAWLTRGGGGRVARSLILLVGVAFALGAAYSSELALRTEPVAPAAAGQELAAFHRLIGAGRVLYLGDDPYATWQLRPAAVSALDSNVRSVGDVALSATKTFGGQQDFDSVDPRTLDRVGYVITSNTPFASQPPANFRVAMRGALFVLYRRTGPTLVRAAPDGPGTPGATLKCRSLVPARSRRRGVAALMSPPVLIPGRGLLPGASASIPLPLPKGTWELSLQYTSDFTLKLAAQGHNWQLPALLSFPGQFFAVGQVTGQGTASPVQLSAYLEKPSRLTGSADLLYASFPTIAATRVPDTRRIVPIDQACGRYVDWYRPG